MTTESTYIFYGNGKSMNTTCTFRSSVSVQLFRFGSDLYSCFRFSMIINLSLFGYLHTLIRVRFVFVLTFACFVQVKVSIKTM